MFTFKKSILCLALGIIAPVSSYAGNYCIAVNNGFGSGGTTFLAQGFTLPVAGTCVRWSGWAKTASTVVLTTDGTACESSDGKVLTFALSSSNPNWLGSGQFQQDYIRMCAAGVSSCPIGSGRDVGNYGGPAKAVSCPSNVSTLPAVHD